MIRADSVAPEVWEAMCTPMHEILPPSGKSGALFLGSWAASVDTELLASNRIRAVVEVLDAPWGSAAATPVSTPQAAPPSLSRAPSSYGFDQARTDGRGASVSASAPGQVGRYKVAIADSTAVDILKPHLDGVVRFIKDRLAVGDNVLVHCQQGVSRSSAIVMAFLMRDRGLTYDSALSFVRSKRKCAKPNSGFEKTLREWESSWRR